MLKRDLLVLRVAFRMTAKEFRTLSDNATACAQLPTAWGLEDAVASERIKFQVKG